MVADAPARKQLLGKEIKNEEKLREMWFLLRMEAINQSNNAMARSKHQLVLYLWQNIQNINCNNEKLHRGENRSLSPLGDQILVGNM